MLLRSTLILGLGIIMMMVGGAGGQGGMGGMGGNGQGYNEDPTETDVNSPPVVPPTPAPTPAPTGKPSRMPTDAPTATPTFSPTPKPSLVHSESPTVEPSHSPHVSPSVSSSAIPSLAPTAPTISPSTAPTTSPSPSMVPSGVPSVQACQVNPDGFFGDPSQTTIEVSFGYELEYKAGNNATEVIDNLENSFSDFLLPFLFASDCPDADSQFVRLSDYESRRVLVSFRRLDTVGISKRPDDMVLDDVTCSEQSDEGNECVVVDGGLTLYTAGNMVASDDETVLEAIKKGMQNGDFNKDPVVRVSYVDLDAMSIPSARDDNQGSAQNTPMRRGVLYGLVAGFATLLLILFAVAWRKRKNKDTDGETSDSFGNSTSNDV